MLADQSTSITYTFVARDICSPGLWTSWRMVARMTAWSRWVRTSAARIRQHARCARTARSMRADLLSSFAL
eukprot:5230610-Prymnesium_polylepis.1